MLRESKRVGKPRKQGKADFNISRLNMEKPCRMCGFLLERELDEAVLNLVNSGKHRCKTKSDFLREAVREKVERDLFWERNRSVTGDVE